MEANKEEALKAKENAEMRFAEVDFIGAKSYALKAKTLYPELEGISQMVATFDVYVAYQAKYYGETNYYSILGLKPSANKEAVKRQYRKMAVLLHPDKNKTVGADGAFKLLSEAWTILSDSHKRTTYDLKRTTRLSGNNQTSHGRLDTFWTVCTSCKVQYEYLRKYVNKRLSCKNCRAIFISVETGTGPVNGSFPYCSWSFVPNNGYGSHGFDGVGYAPNDATFSTGIGVSTFHSGNGYEYFSSNASLQWSSSIEASTVTAAELKSRDNRKCPTKHNVASETSGTPSMCDEFSGSKVARPDKKRKIIVGATFQNGSEEKVSRQVSETKFANGYASMEHDLNRNSNAPLFDSRKLLIEKARTEILKKLKVLKFSSAVNEIPKAEASERTDPDTSARQVKPNKSIPISIDVPDPDFHDFDKDRSEECFKPKQIWALYDEEDGMPRLYCMIREIISIKPFQILITYLGSKTESEFGSIHWLDCGFTKSCGHFRAKNSDVVEQVNVFSHVLSREKAGRGGCVRINPKSGDIWAVYRNWSSDWDGSTPDEVRHQYEMVEVLDDYSEELGVCVSPLLKLAGFKTVYQRNTDRDAIHWIPKRQMLQFSHQVPSYLLKGGEASNFPGKCWDLDPAATPDDLLHTVTEMKC